MLIALAKLAISSYSRYAVWCTYHCKQLKIPSQWSKTAISHSYVPLHRLLLSLIQSININISQDLQQRLSQTFLKQIAHEKFLNLELLSRKIPIPQTQHRIRNTLICQFRILSLAHIKPTYPLPQTNHVTIVSRYMHFNDSMNSLQWYFFLLPEFLRSIIDVPWNWDCCFVSSEFRHVAHCFKTALLVKRMQMDCDWLASWCHPFQTESLSWSCFVERVCRYRACHHWGTEVEYRWSYSWITSRAFFPFRRLMYRYRLTIVYFVPCFLNCIVQRIVIDVSRSKKDSCFWGNG